MVRFHLARYVESLESDAVDATARIAALTGDGSYAERVLERDVKALEAEAADAAAKLDAARAEERDDLHADIEAQTRAFKADARAINGSLAESGG